jgi:redox-sensitive bicupin YhaK (pirin superfamily)
MLHRKLLWVNLPRRDKITAPRYQELKSASIPRATNATEDVQVRVIAGESLGTRGAIRRHARPNRSCNLHCFRLVHSKQVQFSTLRKAKAAWWSSRTMAMRFRFPIHRLNRPSCY